jgi:glycosyltransferase involved in cell wall biosynthesis
MTQPRVPTRSKAAVLTIRTARSPHIVHATECLAGGTLGLLVAATHEVASLGAQQTLVYSRRDDTPMDVETLFPPSVRLIEVPRARGHQLEFIRAMTRELRRLARCGDIDVVHLHSSKAGFVGRLGLLLSLMPVRILYSPHGLAFLNSRRKVASAAYLTLEWLAGRTRFQPVACSESEAQAFARVTRHACYVLENPVDPDFFEVHRKEQATPLVVTIGRVCEQKAPEVFAELAVRVRVDHPNAQFVWIGSGDPRGTELLAAAQVTVTGWLSPPEVRQWLARATVYVQTSRWEGMPLSVIQAQAVGLPCVVTDVVGNRDAIIDGETGFVAASLDELAAHVELLLREPVLRRAISAPARLAAERRFGRARFRQTLAQLYSLTPSVRGERQGEPVTVRQIGDGQSAASNVKSARVATG